LHQEREAMTSRQPGRAREIAGQDWVRWVPVALLIILGLAGLRGAVGTPRWDGPLHQDGVAVGTLLEAVLAILLVITLWRTRAGSQEAVPRKLRGMLLAALGAGMVAVAVTVLVGLHLHLFSRHVRPQSLTPGGSRPLLTKPPTRSQGHSLHIPLQVILYVLVIALLLAGVALSIWWARRLRLPGRAEPDGFIAEDSEELREAVESGRSALRTVDDARAAIIACYLAMENSLAERGTARGIADTPDELLARATETGLVRGTAAARLTTLFYEARFSSHPLDRGQRDAAERALDEMAAALAESAPEGAGT
jgi:Domain of unknown function (DUF4129)